MNHSGERRKWGVTAYLLSSRESKAARRPTTGPTVQRPATYQRPRCTTNLDTDPDPQPSLSVCLQATVTKLGG
jgi:hypothetical protein